jgi:hypothetical protein
LQIEENIQRIVKRRKRDNDIKKEVKKDENCKEKEFKERERIKF